MKRIVTFLLTLALLASSVSLSSMYVLAASGDSSSQDVELSEQDGSVEGSASFDVTGSYVAASDRSETYKVVITFGDLNFKYNPGSMTWQPDTLTYRNDTKLGWTGDSSGTVRVENLSNVAITVSASVSQESGALGGKVTVAVDKNSADLKAAWDGMPRNQAPYTDFTVSVSHTGKHPDPENIEANQKVKVGTVTLTVNKQAVSP